jgi:hypothetical protein
LKSSLVNGKERNEESEWLKKSRSVGTGESVYTRKGIIPIAIGTNPFVSAKAVEFYSAVFLFLREATP